MDLKGTLEKLFRRTPIIINTINHVKSKVKDTLNSFNDKTLVIVITKHDYIEEELKKLDNNYTIIYLK